MPPASGDASRAVARRLRFSPAVWPEESPVSTAIRDADLESHPLTAHEGTSHLTAAAAGAATSTMSARPTRLCHWARREPPASRPVGVVPGRYISELGRHRDADLAAVDPIGIGRHRRAAALNLAFLPDRSPSLRRDGRSLGDGHRRDAEGVGSRWVLRGDPCRALSTKEGRRRTLPGFTIGGDGLTVERLGWFGVSRCRGGRKRVVIPSRTAAVPIRVGPAKNVQLIRQVAAEL